MSGAVMEESLLLQAVFNLAAKELLAAGLSGEETLSKLALIS